MSLCAHYTEYTNEQAKRQDFSFVYWVPSDIKLRNTNVW